MVTFSGFVKQTLNGIIPESDCCAFAQLSAIIATCGSLELSKSGMRINFLSENSGLSQNVDGLVFKYFGTKTEEHSVFSSFGKIKHSFYVPVSASKTVLEECYIARPDEDGYFSLCGGISKYLIEEECCLRAYVRGALLGSGYAGIPSGIDSGKASRGYRLEWLFGNTETAADFAALLLGFRACPKIKQHGQKAVVYITDIEMICDILAAAGAGKAVLEIKKEQAARAVRNSAQRSTNCISSNLNKSVSASLEARHAINSLDKQGILQTLDPKTVEIATLRLQYPDMSLDELAQKCSFSISKSGIRHKFKKLILLAKETE